LYLGFDHRLPLLELQPCANSQMKRCEVLLVNVYSRHPGEIVDIDLPAIGADSGSTLPATGRHCRQFARRDPAADRPFPAVRESRRLKGGHV
jgi:hypothetical protein